MLEPRKWGSRRRFSWFQTTARRVMEAGFCGLEEKLRMIYTRVLDRRVCSVRSPVDRQSGEPSAGSCLPIRQPRHFIPTGKAAPISTMPGAKRLKSRDLIASSWTTRHEITAEILDILRRRIQVRRSQPGHRSKGGEMIETIEIASAGSFGCPLSISGVSRSSTTCSAPTAPGRARSDG
jgi:hypothetical protein